MKGADSKRQSLLARTRVSWRACIHTFRIPHPASNYSPVSPLPFYPKIQKRGDLLVCAEAVPSAWGRLSSFSFSPSCDTSIYLTIDPSKPNFSLTKPFLSTNLFRDRNSLSTTTLARYNSDLLNGSQILLVSAITLVPGINIFYERQRK